MLTHLHIKNFAVIEEIDICFNHGMTVFSGETGAGKSIMVDALSLALGGRADSSLVRTGCNTAEITAIFEMEEQPDIINLLTEHDIDYRGEVAMRRVIRRDGRSRAYINGSSTQVQLLDAVGKCMVDIHGQHAHQSLLSTNIQAQLLDAFGKYLTPLSDVETAWSAWRDNEFRLQSLAVNDDDIQAQIELLKFRIGELHALNVEQMEFNELEQKYNRLNNMTQLCETCQQALTELINSDHSVYSRASRHLSELQNIQQFDQQLSSVIELLNSTCIQINEAGDELRRYLDRFDTDTEQLRDIEHQLNGFHDMARKCKVRPDQLSLHLLSLQEELNQLENNEIYFKELSSLRDTLLAKYYKVAETLSHHRHQAAEKLSRQISRKLHELGMPDSKFSIDVVRLTQDQPQKNGMDKIEYIVALNPGHAPLPLSKVASGGELSRISLAIQVTVNQDKGIPTLIFDEVDSGIGGGIAEIVGKLLHELAGTRQIFCVTHLPQVAAQGDHHLLISKSKQGDMTSVRVNELDHKQRDNEIARMLGGVKITEQTLIHAREMLQKI